jgi:hypothetical protein
MNAVDELRTQAMQLPSHDRALLARDLLLSLEAGDFADDAEAAWAAEIEARSAAVAAGNYTASEWRESIGRLREDLRQRRQQ